MYAEDLKLDAPDFGFPALGRIVGNRNGPLHKAVTLAACWAILFDAVPKAFAVMMIWQTQSIQITDYRHSSFRRCASVQLPLRPSYLSTCARLVQTYPRACMQA